MPEQNHNCTGFGLVGKSTLGMQILHIFYNLLLALSFHSIHTHNNVTKNRNLIHLDLNIMLRLYKFNLHPTIPIMDTMNCGYHTASIRCCAKYFIATILELLSVISMIHIIHLRHTIIVQINCSLVSKCQNAHSGSCDKPVLYTLMNLSNYLWHLWWHICAAKPNWVKTTSYSYMMHHVDGSLLQHEPLV